MTNIISDRLIIRRFVKEDWQDNDNIVNIERGY